jgi:hypothetical protein
MVLNWKYQYKLVIWGKNEHIYIHTHTQKDTEINTKYICNIRTFLISLLRGLRSNDSPILMRSSRIKRLA